MPNEYSRFVEYLQFLASCRRRIAVIVGATALTAPDRCPLSHVVSIDIEITDLAAVRAACERMGWEFRQGQKTYKWWGSHVGDYPLPEGVTEADLGKCDHAIRLPGAEWEIGLMQRGAKYLPVWDFFSGGLQEIRPENGMNGFLQAYAVEKAKIECRKKGRRVTETKREDGSVRLEVENQIMTQRITIDIDPLGNTSVETTGFTGKSCADATRELERALGKVDEGQRSRKPEYYQQAGAGAGRSVNTSQ